MNILKMIMLGFVALEHIYILVLEMFLWTTPTGLGAFGMTLEEAQTMQTLAANQGLYNGFLAAGLIWGMFHPDKGIGFQIQVFFLLCVVAAGVYGGFTAGIRILYIQAIPALITLALVWFLR